jgi:hypothetical protein
MTMEFHKIVFNAYSLVAIALTVQIIAQTVFRDIICLISNVWVYLFNFNNNKLVEQIAYNV